MRLALTVVISLVMSVCAATVSQSISASGQEQPERVIHSRESADARVALEAMTHSMRIVRSGICRMQCRFRYEPIQEGKEKQGDVEQILFLAFDKSQDLYRYDDKEVRHSGRPAQIIVRSDVILSTPGDWTKTGGSTPTRLILRRSRSDLDNPFSGHRDPFATIFADCQGNRMSHSQFGFLDRFLDEMLPACTIVSYDNTSTENVKITIRHESAKSKVMVEYELLLDVSNGYVPIRVLSRHNATKTHQWTEPDVVQVDWTTANGVHVPMRVQASGSMYKKTDLLFIMEWERVNEGLSPTLFSEDAFTPRSGDLMAAANRDEVVIEKIVGVEPPKLPVKQPDPPPRRLRFALILLANALVFGGWMYYLRRRRLASRKAE